LQKGQRFPALNQISPMCETSKQACLGSDGRMLLSIMPELLHGAEPASEFHNLAAIFLVVMQKAVSFYLAYY
jgi:hypothetical protein